jgi:hypothetical protein
MSGIDRAQQKAEAGLATGSRGQLAGKTGDGLAVVTNDHQKNTPKLSDAGISYDVSSRAQKLAAGVRLAGNLAETMVHRRSSQTTTDQLHQKAEGGLNTGVAGTAGPGRGNKNVVVADDRVSKAPKLADTDFSKDLSSRAQKLAAVTRVAQIRTSAGIVARDGAVWRSAGD